MRTALAVLVVSAGFALAATPVTAHHAFAATYDTGKPVVVKGVITKIEFVNPHSWFWLDVKNPDGSVTNWGFEGGSPNSLFRNGVTKNSIPVGTELVIQGYQSKAFPNKGVGINITFPDGRKFLLGGATPGSDTEVATPTKDEVTPTNKDESKK